MRFKGKDQIKVWLEDSLIRPSRIFFGRSCKPDKRASRNLKDIITQQTDIE